MSKDNKYHFIIKFVDFRTRYISDEAKALPAKEMLAQDYRLHQLQKLMNFIRRLETSDGSEKSSDNFLVEIDLSPFESTEDMIRQSPNLLTPISSPEITTEKARQQTITSSIQNFFDSRESSHHDTTIQLFIATFSYDFRLLFRAITTFVTQLTEFLQELNQSSVNLQITLLEDLVYIERPYIMENKHKNFFKNIINNYSDESHVDGFSSGGIHITATVESSNAIMNEWGEGDTKLVKILEFQHPYDRVESYWYRILNEIPFSEMFNQGNKVPRLISIQSVEDPIVGRPLYRHPNDEEPPNIEMIPLVREIMALVEQSTGVRGLNHVLIQHYRDGRDNIAQHSDKTLDIDKETPILNLSFGCSREMFIQNKQNRNRKEKIPLQHGECVIFGLLSNQYWYHEVPKDVTMSKDPLFGTSRVSFTFRKIATFVHSETGCLIGQGSPFKTINDYILRQSHSSDDPSEQTTTRQDLINAFGKENRQSKDFNWEEVYGQGFLIK